MVAFTRFAAIAAVFATASALPTADADSSSVTLDKRARLPDYTQKYIASGASVSFTPNQAAGSFGVDFNTKQDFVVGLGWTQGDTSPITYSGSLTSSGVGFLSVYGWSTDPLIEYYIIEDPAGYPIQGTKKGTVTSDGATYDFYEHTQVDQPSIQGTTTFNQYISIRQSARTSGTVTLANHFDAWKAAGLNLGSLNYQVLAVESWGGSGKGSFKVSK